MEFQARVTIHQRGLYKPDYNEVHRRMAAAGYLKMFVSGSLWQELSGMYHKTTMLGTIDVERATIERELRMIGFAFSIELFQVSATRVFNLEPPVDYGNLLGMLGGVK